MSYDYNAFLFALQKKQVEKPLFRLSLVYLGTQTHRTILGNNSNYNQKACTTQCSESEINLMSNLSVISFDDDQNKSNTCPRSEPCIGFVDKRIFAYV